MNAFDCAFSRLMPRMVATAILVILGVTALAESPPSDRLVRDRHGGIIRGDVFQRKLALVFTGDEFGESMGPILDTLKQRAIKASFLVTGNFLRKPQLKRLVERAIAEGHYVGPHSDKHLLYADWKDFKTRVSKEDFTTDLARNIADLRAIGALTGERPIYFIPPYEHYNDDQVKWAKEMNVTVFNYSPHSGSNRDYIREGDKKFVSSRKLLTDILMYEKQDKHGLNGFILLLHLGSGRKDPFHPRLGPLCDELVKRCYEFHRIDELLSPR
jgi:peptidoglycan/xylan/chitin deacetylase (PgdA/CDA1 family)